MARLGSRDRALSGPRGAPDYLENPFEFGNAPVIAWDPELRITRLNHAFEELTQRGSDEVIGRHIELLFPEDARRTEALEHVASAIAGERWQVVEIPILRADGEVRTVLWNSATVFDADGTTPIATIAQGQDITERVCAENALRESEERFRIAAQTANDVVYEWDLKNEVQWFGDVDGMLGYEPGTFPRKLDGWAGSVHPEDIERTLAQIRTHLETGAPYAAEYRVRQKDGAYRWWSARGAAARAPDGTPVRWIGSITDITERVYAENALRESESRFRQTVDSLPQLVWTCEAEGPCDSLSKQWVEFTGVPESQQLGYGWLEQIHPDDRAQTVAAWEAAVAAGTDFHVEFRIRRYDGEYRWFDTQAVRLRDATGNTVKWVGSNTDLTARKVSETAIAESEDKFRYVFQHSVVAKSITKPTGEIDVNDAFLEMVGYTREELGAGSTWQQISHPDDFAATATYVTSMISGEAESVRFEKRYVHKDGSIIWTDVSTSLRRDADGAPDYFMTTVVDITDRKRAEDEVRRLNAELEQRVLDRTAQLDAANKELEAFSYSVSHDLRAPLRHISGFSTLLLERADDAMDEKSRHYIDTISKSVQDMGVLIDDLLQFSRSGRAELRLLNVNMDNALSEVLEPLRQETVGRDIEWVVGPLPTVVGDPALLRQVWSNLLSNAVKFSRGRSSARIEIGALDDGFGSPEPSAQDVLYVRDNGVGFDMQYAQKLFGVFQRLHSSAEFEGTGIGLANVQRIVHRLGGRVWAESEPDKGATFYFALPRRME